MRTILNKRNTFERVYRTSAMMDEHLEDKGLRIDLHKSNLMLNITPGDSAERRTAGLYSIDMPSGIESLFTDNTIDDDLNDGFGGVFHVLRAGDTITHHVVGRLNNPGSLRIYNNNFMPLYSVGGKKVTNFPDTVGYKNAAAFILKTGNIRDEKESTELIFMNNDNIRDEEFTEVCKTHHNSEMISVAMSDDNVYLLEIAHGDANRCIDDVFSIFTIDKETGEKIGRADIVYNPGYIDSLKVAGDYPALEYFQGNLEQGWGIMRYNEASLYKPHVYHDKGEMKSFSIMTSCNNLMPCSQYIESGEFRKDLQPESELIHIVGIDWIRDNKIAFTYTRYNERAGWTPSIKENFDHQGLEYHIDIIDLDSGLEAKAYDTLDLNQLVLDIKGECNEEHQWIINMPYACNGKRLTCTDKYIAVPVLLSPVNFDNHVHTESVIALFDRQTNEYVTYISLRANNDVDNSVSIEHPHGAPDCDNSGHGTLHASTSIEIVDITSDCSQIAVSYILYYSDYVKEMQNDDDEAIHNTNPVFLHTKVFKDLSAELKCGSMRPEVCERADLRYWKVGTSDESVSDSAPVVNAGEDVVIKEGETIVLNGVIIDNDSDIISYQWTRNGRIVSRAQQYTFAAIEQDIGDNVFSFRATDKNGNFDADSVTVSVKEIEVENRPPVVNAGLDQTVVIGRSIHLKGIVSDPDGNIASVAWTDGSTLISNEKTLTYTPTSLGSIVLTFGATDDKGLYAFDTMTILVESKNELNETVSAGSDVEITFDDSIVITGVASNNSGELIQTEWRDSKGDVVSASDNLIYNGRISGLYAFTFHGIYTNETLSDSMVITVRKESIAPKRVLNLTTSSDLYESIICTWTTDSTAYPTAQYRLRRDGIVIDDNITSPYLDNVPAGTYQYIIEAYNDAGTSSSDMKTGVSLKREVEMGSVVNLVASTDLYENIRIDFTHNGVGSPVAIYDLYEDERLILSGVRSGLVLKRGPGTYQYFVKAKQDTHSVDSNYSTGISKKMADRPLPAGIFNASDNIIGGVNCTWINSITEDVTYSLFEDNIKVAENITSPYLRVVSAGRRNYFVMVSNDIDSVSSHSDYGLSLNTLSAPSLPRNVHASDSIKDEVIITWDKSEEGYPTPTYSVKEDNNTIDNDSVSPVVLSRLNFGDDPKLYTVTAINSHGTSSASDYGLAINNQPPVSSGNILILPQFDKTASVTAWLATQNIEAGTAVTIVNNLTQPTLMFDGETPTSGTITFMNNGKVIGTNPGDDAIILNYAVKIMNTGDILGAGGTGGLSVNTKFFRRCDFTEPGDVSPSNYYHAGWPVDPVGKKPELIRTGFCRWKIHQIGWDRTTTHFEDGWITSPGNQWVKDPNGSTSVATRGSKIGRKSISGVMYDIYSFTGYTLHQVIGVGGKGGKGQCFNVNPNEQGQKGTENAGDGGDGGIYGEPGQPASGVGGIAGNSISGDFLITGSSLGNTAGSHPAIGGGDGGNAPVDPNRHKFFVPVPRGLPFSKFRVEYSSTQKLMFNYDGVYISSTFIEGYDTKMFILDANKIIEKNVSGQITQSRLLPGIPANGNSSDYYGVFVDPVNRRVFSYASPSNTTDQITVSVYDPEQYFNKIGEIQLDGHSIAIKRNQFKRLRVVEDKIYIEDTINHKIVIFNLDGSFIESVNFTPYISLSAGTNNWNRTTLCQNGMKVVTILANVNALKMRIYPSWGSSEYVEEIRLSFDNNDGMQNVYMSNFNATIIGSGIYFKCSGGFKWKLLDGRTGVAGSGSSSSSHCTVGYQISFTA